MTVNEIRESGKLEYYVLGLLSPQEIAEVEGYLLEFPELKRDYYEIQRSMQEFAKTASIAPQRNLEADIIKTIRAEGKTNPIKPKPKTDNSSNKGNSGNGLKNLLFLILGVLAMGAAWFAFDKNNDYQELQQQYNQYRIDCDSINNMHLAQIRLYDQLSNPNNNTLNLTPTEGYNQTNLLFHFNPIDRQNFIQIKNLPAIASNQAFQLWSLKANTDPIPLTVFNQGDGFVIPVDFEDGTNTYAITIEAEGGALVPTLTRLIGTVSIA